MTDRELLELAAKATGYGITYHEYVSSFWDDLMGKRWNPLNDDSDAFRLAVRLGLFASPAHALGFVAAMGDTDPAAATRRFIVEAAAGIGEGMK